MKAKTTRREFMFQLRLSKEEKAVLRLASEYESASTVAGWVRSAAVQRAKEVVEKYREQKRG